MASITKRLQGGYQAQVFLSGRRRSKTFVWLFDAKRRDAQMRAVRAAGVAEGSTQPLAVFIEARRTRILEAYKHPRHESAVLGYPLFDPISEILAKDSATKDVEA